MTRKTVSQLLTQARKRLRRLAPLEAHAAQARGALIVDTRGSDDRRSEGVIPGSVHVPLSVLEWRADPACETHDPHFDALHRQIVVVCNDGFSSSLAAVRLQQLGYPNATDLDGGFRAWKAAGLPVESPARPRRRRLSPAAEAGSSPPTV